MEHLKFKSNYTIFHSNQGRGGSGNKKTHVNRPENWHQLKKDELLKLIQVRQNNNIDIKIPIHFELSNIDNDEIKDDLSLIQQLDNKTKTLVSIKQDKDKIIANVQFKDKESCNKFINEKFEKITSPLGYLINTIKESDIYDKISDTIFPEDFNEDTDYWFELWIIGNKDGFLNKLKELKHLLFNTNPLVLDDVSILVVRTSIAFIKNNIGLIDIKEIRFAKRYKYHYLELDIEEKQIIDKSILERITIEDSNTLVVLIDSGVNKNPLLEKIITNDFLLTTNQDYGVDDNFGHGTGMAGLCLYGDFSDLINKNNNIVINNKLASIKIYNPKEDSDSFLTAPASIIEEAIKISEEKFSDHNKLYVSASSKTTEFKYTPYSIDLDSNIYNKKILFLIAVGNFSEHNTIHTEYKEKQKKSYIEDPSQSWNALSVGAYTNKDDYKALEEKYTPLYKKGDISPFSKFKNKEWKNFPLKPEVLFEGGNAVVDTDKKVVVHDNLLPLTTSATFNKDNYWLARLNGTSCAVALAGNFAAKLMQRYPQYWPETIKALMVHSAEYTQYMEEQRKKVNDKYERLHIYSYGIPNLEKAKESIENKVTLIAEEEIYFQETKEDCKDKYTAKKFKLPFPKDVLQGLGDTKIQLKITLSYFIKPNSLAKDNLNIDKFKYQSYGFRFDLKNPNETDENFTARVSNQNKDEEGNKINDRSALTEGWELGVNLRKKIAGTILKDTWKGTATELANIDGLIVYPIGGWWKDNKKIEDKKTRFSLIVSIETDKEDIKLYTTIKTILNIDTPILIN